MKKIRGMKQFREKVDAALETMKTLGFASRKVAAFLAGTVVGLVIGGCSVFGPGVGASVY